MIRLFHRFIGRAWRWPLQGLWKQGLGYAEEARQILVLESAVLKRKGLSKASLDAARVAGKGLHGVLFGRAKAAPKRKKKPADARPNSEPE